MTRVTNCVNWISEKGGFDCLAKLNITLWQREASKLRHLCLLWTYRTVTSFVLLMSRWIPWACPDQTQAHKSICVLRTSDLCFLKRNSNTYSAVLNRLWLCSWAIFRIFLTWVDLDWIKVGNLHVCAAFHRSGPLKWWIVSIAKLVTKFLPCPVRP